jgi:hypothetical protein
MGLVLALKRGQDQTRHYNITKTNTFLLRITNQDKPFKSEE